MIGVEREYSAGVFIPKVIDGKISILFLSRENKWFDIPKGHIEKGESKEQAAIREAFEESGIKVELLPYYEDSLDYAFSFGGKKIAKNVALFLAREAGNQKIRISHEHTGFKWLSLNEAMVEVEKKRMYKDTFNALSRALSYIEKQFKIDQINSEYASLPGKDRSWDLSKTFVPGDGPLSAKTMVLGQAPGANEDILRKPFVGRSGKVLDEMLKLAGLERNKVYITSCVQFFPPKNRGPTDEEVERCREFLIRQIELINPKNIILLGNFACNSMLGYDKVSQNHGKVVKKDGRSFFIAFHPAMALRSSVVVAKLMREDFASFKEKL